MQIGVDIGGSLTKFVTVNNGARECQLLEHTNVEGVAAEVQSLIASDEHASRSGNRPDNSGQSRSYDETASSVATVYARSIGPSRTATSPAATAIYLTGCGAKNLAKHLGTPAKITDELESACAGARQLAIEHGLSDGAFVLTSLGTGTPVFHVSPTSCARVAGTGLGGGTITGLGKLLLSTSDFSKIMELAARGNRKNVDLMVSDLYPDAGDSPVMGHLTAANFGRAAKNASCGIELLGKNEGETSHSESRLCADSADVASAIVQMVIESLGVLSIQVARTYGSDLIIVAGSPTRHPEIRRRFLELGQHLGHRFAFLENGAFCGALGAILLGEATKPENCTQV